MYVYKYVYSLYCSDNMSGMCFNFFVKKLVYSKSCLITNYLTTNMVLTERNRELIC